MTKNKFAGSTYLHAYLNCLSYVASSPRPQHLCEQNVQKFERVIKSRIDLKQFHYNIITDPRLCEVIDLAGELRWVRESESFSTT